MRLLISIVASTSVLVSACGTPTTGQAPEPAPVSGRCNAAPAQFAVGRNADAALENEARARAGAKTVRTLKPNQIVTMEFNAERLSLSVDDAGRVTRVSCG
ncbi:I78 family peptidase inhibitor [Polaromonas sp. YR568]|uniref:I78 family peptidase inhibitor n=1 Tax=Polaromonas sp. YR568 TaxID=1855301 RepID=UPI00398C0619